MRANAPPDTQDCQWLWTHEQKDVFEKIKETVSKAPVLKYFSESDLAENLVEASKDALGFLLMLHGQLVTCGGGSIRLAEGKYSQIETFE